MTASATPSLSERLILMGETIVDRVAHFVPNVIGAVLLLLVGWIVAKLLRAISHRLLLLLDKGVEKLLGPARAARVRLARSADLLGTIVFWAVLLFFVTGAANVLGLETFSLWLARLLEHLPTVIAGLLIVVAGYLLSRFVADLILSAAVRLAPPQRAIVARTAQVSILIGALLVGADQIGIKVTFLAIFAAAIAAAVAGGAVVAISIGARTHVANLIGAQRLRQTFEIGSQVRVAGFEGRILEINGHGALLETDDGRVSLPGHLFSEQPVVLLTTSEAPRG